MADDILGLTAQIVSAHVQRNQVDVDALPNLIREVHQTLASLGANPRAMAHALAPVAPVMDEDEVEEMDDAPEPTVAAAKQRPAVPIAKSVFNDHIICLEDGKRMTMLKRHLMTEHNMTVDQYRTKWGLPSNYPTVAPDYAETRSRLAKKMGLGRAAQPKRGGRKAGAKRSAE